MREINLRDAILNFKQAWNEVTPETIQHCWAHTKILSDEQNQLLRTAADTESAIEDLEKLMAFFKKHHKCTLTAEEFVKIDENEPTEEIPDVADLAHEALDVSDIEDNDEAEVEEERKKVSKSEAEKSLECIESFYWQLGESDSLDLIRKLQRKMRSIVTNTHQPSLNEVWKN